MHEALPRMCGRGCSSFGRAFDSAVATMGPARQGEGGRRDQQQGEMKRVLVLAGSEQDTISAGGTAVQLART